MHHCDELRLEKQQQTTRLCDAMATSSLLLQRLNWRMMPIRCPSQPACRWANKRMNEYKNENGREMVRMFRGMGAVELLLLIVTSQQQETLAAHNLSSSMSERKGKRSDDDDANVQ